MTKQTTTQSTEHVNHHSTFIRANHSDTERYRRRIIHDTKRAEINHSLTIILGDLDFGWNKEEITVFLRLWQQGYPLHHIAPRLRPDLTPDDAFDETALLFLHLIRRGKIDLSHWNKR